MWHENSEGGEWLFGEHRKLFAWEFDLVQRLNNGLLGVEVGEEVDSWKWKPEKGEVFSVKSCYTLLENLFLLDEGVSVEEEEVFHYLWKSPALSKVLAFSWMLLL